MFNAFTTWLASKPFSQQLIVVALFFDLVGATAGYALHPYLGVDPLIGVLYGLVAGSVPTVVWMQRNRPQ